MSTPDFLPIQVTAEECSGHFEKMLRRFVRKVKNEGILEEYRESLKFVKPSQKRRARRKTDTRNVEKRSTR